MKRILLILLLAALVLPLPGCTETEPGYMVITDTDKDTADVNSSGALTTILAAHHEIYKGNYYYIKNFTSLEQGNSADFLFITDNSTVPHVQWQLASESEAEFYMYEGVDVSSNGTSMTVFNANRNSPNTATMQAFSSPTLAGGSLGDSGQGGILISAAVVGSGKETTANRITTYELIGKAGTTYWVRLTNVSSQTSWIDYDFNWYEEEL